MIDDAILLDSTVFVRDSPALGGEKRYIRPSLAPPSAPSYSAHHLHISRLDELTVTAGAISGTEDFSTWNSRIEQRELPARSTEHTCANGRGVV